MFTQECFIRERDGGVIQSLIGLGYGSPTQTIGNAISASNNGVIVELILLPEDKLNCTIDCGNNKKMFLALAALRDDSDINQWFVCDEGTMHYDKEGFPMWLDFEGDWKMCRSDDFFAHSKSFWWHKATPKEIVEHF